MRVGTLSALFTALFPTPRNAYPAMAHTKYLLSELISDSKDRNLTL